MDAAEIERFARLGSAWWNPSGPYVGLHQMNQVRIPLIRRAASYVQQGRAGAAVAVGPAGSPFAGLRVVDVGCGGGILSEARVSPVVSPGLY